jgi:NAD(P)H-dependent FMN reductase
MTSIVAISGSLRAGSYNTALLRAAAELAPTGASLAILSIAMCLSTTETSRRATVSRLLCRS